MVCVCVCVYSTERVCPFTWLSESQQCPAYTGGLKGWEQRVQTQSCSLGGLLFQPAIGPRSHWAFWLDLGSQCRQGTSPSYQTFYQLHTALGVVLQLFLAAKHRCLRPPHSWELSHHSGQHLHWLGWSWFPHATS